MLIQKNQFKKLSKEDQERYLFFWSALYERQAELQAIEFTEKTMMLYSSDLKGIELVNLKPDLSNHERYAMCIEDIENYEAKIKKILVKLEA